MRDNVKSYITYERSVKGGHSFKSRLSAYMQKLKVKGMV